MPAADYFFESRLDGSRRTISLKAELTGLLVHGHGTISLAHTRNRLARNYTKSKHSKKREGDRYGQIDVLGLDKSIMSQRTINLC